MTGTAITELAPVVGVRAASAAVGAPQANWYRRHRQSPAPQRPAPVPHRDRAQPRALPDSERKEILAELHPGRFADISPAEVWAILDNGLTFRDQYRTLVSRAQPPFGVASQMWSEPAQATQIGVIWASCGTARRARSWP